MVTGQIDTCITGSSSDFQISLEFFSNLKFQLTGLSE